MRRNAQRAGAVLVAVAVAVLALAAPAVAHVTVNPNSATQGGYTKVAFRVPNEKATASTVKLEVNLPADTPVASVSLKPVAGWTAVAEKTKLPTPIKTDDGEITEGVTRIIWTANEGVSIQPGQFQEFEVSMGPLPKVDQITFKALQTYSDGDIVRWIDEPKTDGTEVEHPAPVLKLVPGTGGGAHGESRDLEAAAVQEPTGAGGWGLGLGIAGTLLGLAGLVVALLAYRRTAGPQPRRS